MKLKRRDARVMVFAVLMVVAAFAYADDPYLVERIPSPDGDELHKIVVPGYPPTIKAPAVVVPAPDKTLAINALSNVPAFDWCYGCSATSGAMMAGYYDNNGYSDMYTGPTNGGVCPLNNSSWGSGECPLSATHQGYDGLGTRGHVDDYYVSYGSTAPDPYITGAWTQHAHADCTGDFMKTNQSAYGNKDGSTAFYYWDSGNPYSGSGASNEDGGYGLHLFFESRGYTVDSHFNQYIYGWEGRTIGFTYAQFQQEIDAGRPVLIHIEGHTMLGYGYNTTGSKIYIHDTWDHLDHEMTWAGTYGGGSVHYAVTVMRLEEVGLIFTDGFESGNTTAWSSKVP